MKEKELWFAIFNLHSIKIRALEVGTLISWVDDFPELCQYDLNQGGKDLLQVSDGLYMVFLIDDLPYHYQLSRSFFQEVLSLRMYCHLNSDATLNEFTDCHFDCRKEIGKCLINLQIILDRCRLPWRTLWNHNLVPISVSTANRYKNLASKQ